MNDPQTDWESAWEGLEPEQPKPRQRGLWLALAAAAFLTLGLCALAYFALQQRTMSEPGLTLPGEEQPLTPASEQSETIPPTEVPAAGIAPTVTLPGEFATPPQPPPAADIIASRASAAPVIDGDSAEWAGVPVYSSPHIVFTADTWDGSDDLAASWQMSWDEANLYLVISVADDVHAQDQTGNQTYRGDSVELQIDADRAGDYGPAVSPDDYQISLSPGDFAGIPPSAFLFQGTAGGEMRDAAFSPGIIVAATPGAAGYTLEASIPWRDLNLTPAPGLIVGLAVNVNDNDRPGTATQEMMKSNAPNRRFADPTTWGTLSLQ